MTNKKYSYQIGMHLPLSSWDEPEILVLRADSKEEAMDALLKALHCVYSDMVIYPGGLTVLKIDTAEKAELPSDPMSKMDILKAIKECDDLCMKRFYDTKAHFYTKEHEDQYMDELEWQSRKERIECVNLITRWAKDHGMSYEEALGDVQVYIDLMVDKY